MGNKNTTDVSVPTSPTEIQTIQPAPEYPQQVVQTKPRIYIPPYLITLSDRKSMFEILTKDGKGNIINSLRNFVIIIKNDPALAGRIRFNILDGRPEISGMPWNNINHPIQDDDLFQLRLYLSTEYGISRMSELKQAVQIIACANKYHPVVEYLETLEWDGTPRIADLFPRYLGSEKSDYNTAITHMLLNAIIERAYHPGCKYDTCVVLADTRQGTGKSTMCKFLSLNDIWYTDNLTSLSNQKQAFETIKGHIVVELSEMLATKQLKTIEEIKSYLSRTSETYRTPYDIFPTDYPRQCVFIGTTNKPDFLPSDKTGNRRFIPVICDGNKAKYHLLDNQTESREFVLQCFGEALVLGRKNGFSLILDKKYDSELQAIQQSRTPEDSRVGMIQAWLDDCEENIVCSRMIWDNVFGDGYSQPSSKELSDISEIMNLEIDGWERFKGVSGHAESNKYVFKGQHKRYGQQRAWQRIKTASGNSSDTDDGTNGFHPWPGGIPNPFDSL